MNTTLRAGQSIATYVFHWAKHYVHVPNHAVDHIEQPVKYNVEQDIRVDENVIPTLGFREFFYTHSHIKGGAKAHKSGVTVGPLLEEKA